MENEDDEINQVSRLISDQFEARRRLKVFIKIDRIYEKESVYNPIPEAEASTVEPLTAG